MMNPLRQRRSFAFLLLLVLLVPVLAACGGTTSPTAATTPGAAGTTPAPAAVTAPTAAETPAAVTPADTAATAPPAATTAATTAAETPAAAATAAETATEATQAPADTAAAADEGCLEEHLQPVADKYDPPIELTTVREASALLKYDAGDDVNNTPWTRAYEQKYGIKVTTLWEVNTEQYAQKMNLTLSSGDLPDFFFVNATQFKQLADADQIMDLTEVYEQHATEGVKALLNENGPQALQSATIDGRLMAIPFTGVPREGLPVIWMRTDWLKKLGLTEPKTMDDLLKISEAFTTQDPDGNGQNDTFGITLDKQLTEPFSGFVNGFHAAEGIWIKGDGDQLVYSSIQPEMRAALQQMQAMYKAGQIDPEFGTKDFSKVAEDITAGKIGIWIGSVYGGAYPLQQNRDQNPNADWEAYPLVSVEGEPARVQVELPGTLGYWVVRKGVEHPEAVLKMLDFWNESSYRPHGCQAIYTALSATKENQSLWTMSAVRAYRGFSNVATWEALVEPLSSDNPDLSQLTPPQRDVYDNVMKYRNGDKSLWWYESIFGPEGSLSVVDHYRDNDLYINDQFLAAPVPAMAQKQSTLDRLQEETFTKIISGASPIEEFDRFVAQWKQLGGDQITKEVNEWYAGQTQ